MSARWWMWAALGVVTVLAGMLLASFLSPPTAFCVGSLFGITATAFSYEMQGSRWYP